MIKQMFARIAWGHLSAPVHVLHCSTLKITRKFVGTVQGVIRAQVSLALLEGSICHLFVFLKLHSRPEMMTLTLRAYIMRVSYC